MRRAWRGWVALLDRREPGTALALLRIAAGLCVLYTLGHVLAAGVLDPLWVDRSFGGIRPLGGTPLVNALGGPTPAVVRRVVAACLFFGAMLTVGVGGRVTAFATLQTYIALVPLNTHAGGSYDQLLSNALWLLVLAPSTATLSVDCRLRTGAWSDPTPVAAWTRYLAVFQLLLCYWTTGLQKVSAYWTPGGGFSALYYILQQPDWHHREMHAVAWIYPLTQVATATVWAWEVAAPLWLLACWYRLTADRPGRLRAWSNRWRLRSAFAAVGITFHLGILLVMNIGPFSWVSLAYYACLWSPAEWERAWRALRDRLRPMGLGVKAQANPG